MRNEHLGAVTANRGGDGRARRLPGGRVGEISVCLTGKGDHSACQFMDGKAMSLSNPIECLAQWGRGKPLCFNGLRKTDRQRPCPCDLGFLSIQRCDVVGSSLLFWVHKKVGIVSCMQYRYCLGA